MTMEEMRNELFQLFIYDGRPWGRLPTLGQAEVYFEKWAEEEFGGYWSLQYAFCCCFLEAIEQLNTELRPKVKEPLSNAYPVFMVRLIQAFRSITGTQQLALKGYPLHALTLLRNAFDDLVMTVAVLHSMTDFIALEGLVEGEDIDLRKIRNRRKDIEYEVRRLILGTKSGLSESSVSQLVGLDEIFDFEVHGARLTLAKEAGWLKGEVPLSIVPKEDRRSFAMYMNRSCEIGWLTHRLLPLIQPVGVALGDEWKAKWRVVDNFFRMCVESMSTELKPDIGLAFCELVDKKFSFSQDSEFPI